MPPTPIRLSTGFNNELYKDRISLDSWFKEKTKLIEYGNNVFNNLTAEDIIQPLQPGPVDFEDQFWDFRAVNGLQSLKQGYYKIVSEPNYRDNGIPTLAAHVLFSKPDELEKVYLYFANIGPLVNRYAVCGNLSTNKRLQSPFYEQEKPKFLKSLIDRIIYVSRAEYVTEGETSMKEVLWFIW